MDFLFLFLVTFVFGFWICKKIKQYQNLPPGPWGIPILGYLPFLNTKYPHLTMTELSKKFGSIYGIQMGNLYTVVLSDNKLIREAFSKESFSGRAPLYLTHGVMNGNGIICAEGALWKDQRKLITSWLKSFGMGKHSLSREKLEKRIASGVDDILKDIQNQISEQIDLSGIVTNGLGNIINEIVFGFKFPAEDKTWNWLRTIQEEGCHEMGVAGVVNFLPFVRFFSPRIRKTIDFIKKGQNQTHKLYASIINQRRELIGLPPIPEASYSTHKELGDANSHLKCIKFSLNTNESEFHYFDPKVLIPTKEECILDNFLAEQKKRYENNEDMKWNVRDEQMLYLLGDMFGAGLDTTSVTLAWYFLYMAMNKDEQEIVRKEIQEICPEGVDIDHEKLPKVMASICETQRIRSVVPVGIPHGCIQECYLGNYRIPRGTMVVPLQWALHMDPDVWEDPETFNPSRFLTPDGTLLKPQEFIPFQTGKRMCPGDELSRMLTSGVLVKFFRHFRVSLACEEPTDEEMLGNVGVTLTPPNVTYHIEKI